MKRVETRVTTPRSPEDVYAYLADFNNQAEWRFDVVSSELISGEPADFRSDQFSFGAILYEMAAGQRAFEGRTPAETLALTLAEEPPPLASKRSVPAAFAALVEKAKQALPAPASV